MKELDYKSALVVFSGGQDSTTCLGWALNRFEKVHAVSIDYGQKHKIELEAAKAVISFFENATGRLIPHEVITLPQNVFAGTSPLTDPKQELETYESFEQMDDVIGNRIEKTFVPMRNAAFLMLAANRAAVAGISNIVTGVCMMDNANYPDCRPGFINDMEQVINSALGNNVYRGLQIKTPLMYLTKAETVKLALTLPFTYAALAFSHTAYDGKYPPIGTDHASVLRAKGFEEAFVPDPLVLRAVSENLMPLPDTRNYSGIYLDDAMEILTHAGVIS